MNEDSSAADTGNSSSATEASEKIRCESLGILTDKPKYKHYNTVNARKASFNNWPTTKTQDITVLSEAGFAYTGKEDAVRCYFCGIGLKDWPPGANPWEQHTLASPTCGHVKQCRGTVYIRKLTGIVDEDIDTDNDEIDDSFDVVDTVKVAINRNKGSVGIAREYYPDENLITRAVKLIIKDNRHKTFSAVDLVKVIQEIEEKYQLTLDIETDGEDSDPEEDIKEMEETNRKLKDPLTCKICFDSIACIITLPCGHMVSCSQCIAALSACAVCRGQIKGTVRALMAV